MRLLLGVNDFVPAERACLPEALAADFTFERTRARMYRHVAGEVVVRVEDLAADFAGEGFGGTVTSFAAYRTCSRARHWQ